MTVLEVKNLKKIIWQYPGCREHQFFCIAFCNNHSSHLNKHGNIPYSAY